MTDEKRWFLSERRERFQAAMSLSIDDWVVPRRNAGLHPRAKLASVTLCPGQSGEKQKVHFVILVPVRHPSVVLNICVTDTWDFCWDTQCDHCSRHARGPLGLSFNYKIFSQEAICFCYVQLASRLASEFPTKLRWQERIYRNSTYYTLLS